MSVRPVSTKASSSTVKSTPTLRPAVSRLRSSTLCCCSPPLTKVWSASNLRPGLSRGRSSRPPPKRIATRMELASNLVCLRLRRTLLPKRTWVTSSAAIFFSTTGVAVPKSV